MVKSKLARRSGSVALRQWNPSMKRGHKVLSLRTWNNDIVNFFNTLCPEIVMIMLTRV